jgi:hypothetical protein
MELMWIGGEYKGGLMYFQKINKRFGLAGLIGLMAVTFGLAQDKIPVGVLKSGQTPNWADGIYQMLDFEKDFQAEIIYDATPATLSKFKAVIVPQLSNASKYKDWIEPLRSWVEAGGGLMTTHDAVGYRMHPVIFPEIAKGHFHYFDESKKPFWVELCLTRERPFTTFLRQGDRIPLAYYDYITLEPGPRGRVLARGVEKSEEPARTSGPAIVYGEVGKGRYVACGTLPGFLADEKTIEPPAGAERQLLSDCVRYLAGALNDPAPESNEIGAEVELGGLQPNLLFNGGAEVLDNNKPLLIFSLPNNKLMPEAGITTHHKRTGDHALRLRAQGYKPKDASDMRKGVISIRYGYEGAEAHVIPKNKARYKFSFWLKGNPDNAKQPLVRPIIFVWQMEEGKWKRDVVRLQNAEFWPSEDWKHCEISFVCEGFTRIMPVVSIHTHPPDRYVTQEMLDKAVKEDARIPDGPEIFVDDAVLTCIPFGGDLGLTVDALRAGAEDKVEARWHDVKGKNVPELAKIKLGTSVEAPSAMLDVPNYNPWPESWHIHDLSGNWKIRKLTNVIERIDARRVTTPNPSNDEGTVQGYWKSDYDDSSWPERTIPGFWGTEDKPLDPFAKEYTLAKYNKTDFIGVGWHRTRFTVKEKPADKRLILYFDRVHYEATVYLNDVKLGVNRGGNSPFEFDITDTVRVGENTLAVRVFLDHTRYAYFLERYGFGGIMGRVLLQERPVVYANAMLIDPKLASSEAIFKLDLMNASGKARVSRLALEIEPAAVNQRLTGAQGKKQNITLGEQTLQPGRNQMDFTVKLEDAVLWSPDYPHLYQATLLADDQVAATDRFGFREFKTDAHRMLLNGKPILPVGIVMNFRTFYNLPGIWENQYNIMRRVLAAHKEWGVNMIFPQGAHLFYPRLFYDICDELGIMIQEWQAAVSASVLLKTCALFDDEDTIKRVRYIYNHPSFVMFTIGNECRDAIFIEPINHVYDLFKRIDGQARPVCAVSGGWPDKYVFKEDVIDVHAYFGVISGHALDTGRRFEDANQMVWNAHERALPIGNWEMGGNRQNFNSAKYQHGRELFAAQSLDKHKLLELLVPQAGSYYLLAEYAGATMYGLRRLLVTDYAKAMRDPDFDEVKEVLHDPKHPMRQDLSLESKYRTEYVVKNGIEECRRLGDLMRAGFGIQFGNLSSLFYVRDAEGKVSLEYFDPSALRTGTLVATELYSTYKRYYNPVFICANVFDKNCFAGRKLNFTVYAINDTQEDSNPWQARIVILDKNGEVVDDRIAEVGSVKAFKRNLLDFSIDLSSELPTGLYDIRMYLLEDDNVVSDNYYTFFALNAKDLDQRIDVGKKRVAVYDVSRNTITTSGILRQMGVQFDLISDFSKLPEYDVLIIGAESIDSDVLKQSETIEAWLNAGGRLLQFEQYNPVALPWLTGMSIIKRQGGNIGNPVVIDHPIFAKIDADENWDTWNGQLKRAFQCGRQGGVFTALIGPLNKTMLALGCQYAPRASENAVQMLIAEAKIGSGLALLSQPASTFRYDYDSVATKYIQNCVKYILSDESRFAEPISDLMFVDVDHRRCGYLDITEIAQRKIEADKAWFTAAKKGFKRCGNVRFVLPKTKSALITKPVEFKLPEAVQYMDPEWEKNKQVIDTDQGPLLKNNLDALYIMATLPESAGMVTGVAARITLHYKGGKTAVRELTVGKDIALETENSDLKNAAYVGGGFYVTFWQALDADVAVERIVIEPLTESGVVIGGITMTLVRGKIHT